MRFVISNHSGNDKKINNELMKQSFEDINVASDEHYNWQYLENPVGKGIVLIAFDGEVPVGGYAAIPCLYQYNEKTFQIMLGMNLVVSPPFRGRGISTKLVLEFNKHINSSQSIIGVPNDKATRLHMKNTRDFLKLTLLIRPVMLSKYFHNKIASFIMKPFDKIWKKKNPVKSLEYKEMFDKRFDDFEKITRRENVIRQVRNSDFLNWRYKTNPKKKYKVFVVEKSNREIEGYIITRVAEFNGKQFGFVMDFVITNKSESIKQLVRNALNDFWDSKVSLAAVVCLTNDKEYEVLREEGFYICPDFLRPHPFKFFVKKLNLTAIKNNIILDPKRWFFMLGDYETF